MEPLSPSKRLYSQNTIEFYAKWFQEEIEANTKKKTIPSFKKADLKIQIVAFCSERLTEESEVTPYEISRLISAKNIELNLHEWRDILASAGKN